ncbi:hypothetical protein BRC81_05720 [Halobacteriales archaeon QS_1_68_20]|nr:MAG: hypothetical protein BRC81_05720 [Halobacteriales archaeon QS_1_68_20]
MPILVAVLQTTDLGVTESLLLFLVFGVSGLFIVISMMERDLEENIGDLQSDLNKGFDRVVDAIEESPDGSESGEDEEMRTDGSGLPDETDEKIEAEIEPSGSGAFGGMLAGGAAGLPFGPAGVVVGGILGGLIGNEIEYQNLKEQEQARLKDAAYDALFRHTGLRQNTIELIDITGPRNTENSNWHFDFRERGRQHKHRVELDPESKVWTHQRIE